MGYTTDFEGRFNIDQALAPEHKAYLEKFNETRRMARDAAKAETLPDPVRLAAGLPIGLRGAYFVGGGGSFGQEHDASVRDYNMAPAGQPGLWCKWKPNEDGTAIEWDGGEKFYDYVEWIVYLIEHFLGPWGYKLNGAVRWRGEEFGDIGTIRIVDNVVKVNEGWGGAS